MPNISASTDCEPKFKQRLGSWAVGLGAALLLLWPAALNRYPLVFSDTGTYLSQIVERHLGWDRPVFYSLAILPLHLTLTTWPVVLVQALLTAWVLALALRAFARCARALPAVVALLAVASPLPWIVSELIPDFTTPLLAIVLALLIVTPDRLRPWERWAMAAIAAGFVAMHQSNVPLAFLLVAVLAPLRRWLGGAAARPGRAGLLLAGGAPIAALLALIAVNLIGHGRLSPAPYGNIFVLARSLDDGPAMDVLRRHCPAAGWRLCIMAGSPRAPDADDFLWKGNSPLYRAGGPKVVAGEAGAILTDALREEPGAVLRAAFTDWLRQLGMVATGDGLLPWPNTVGPVIHRDFPSVEARRYDAALQTRGALAVPGWMQALHTGALAAGSIATLVMLALALRRHLPVAGLCAAVLVCLLANAAITGALSGPHDRYQNRVAWLAVFTPLVAGLALRRERVSLSRLPDREPAGVGTPTAWSR